VIDAIVAKGEVRCFKESCAVALLWIWRLDTLKTLECGARQLPDDLESFKTNEKEWVNPRIYRSSFSLDEQASR
jgi:hypothetical protein